MCPGQDLRYWTPKDIFEVSCAGCRRPIEFFKDDLKRTCPHCGRQKPQPEERFELRRRKAGTPAGW